MRYLSFLALILLLSLPAASAMAQPCVLVDNGNGTVDLPPAGCGYLSPTDVHELIDNANLPPGTTIEFDVSHNRFFCSQGGGPTGYGGSCSVVVDPETCEGPGPFPGTVVECFGSDADITLTGTGALAGYSEQLTVPLFTEVLSNRGPGDPNPSFTTQMTSISGALPPAASATFCALEINGGSDHSGGGNAGQVTLTPVPLGGHFVVDSFFDVEYSMTYAGCPGSVLDGIAGTSSLQTVRMEAVGIGSGTGPSLSEWGALLVVLLGMIAATLAITQRESALAVNGPAASSSRIPTIRDRALFARLLAVACGVHILACVAAYTYFGELAARDIIGGALTAGAVAYLLHLWLSAQDEGTP